MSPILSSILLKSKWLIRDFQKIIAIGKEKQRNRYTFILH